MSAAPAPSGSGVAGASAAAGASAPAGASGPAGATGPGVQTVAGTQAKAVYHGSRAKKVVALTFDDGYNPVALRQILAILKREKITATFFPYGWAVTRDPPGWKLVVAAGYPIGNHTLSHATLTQLTPAQVTRRWSRPQDDRPVQRRPLGRSDATARWRLQRSNGTGDRQGRLQHDRDVGRRHVRLAGSQRDDDQGPRDPGHERLDRADALGPLNTPKALPGIIASYRARGFTFVTVPELIGVG